MAKKISQLTQATQVKSDDVTVIVQDGETKKLPLNMMVTKRDIENKKVAGLAKLDEIEATYENDTYTPTIAVKNKSSVKVGEGDGVDYSANVMDGHVKSAILKGQTLVNLLTYFMPNVDYMDNQYRIRFSNVDNFDKITIVNKNSKTIKFSYFSNGWQEYEIPAFNNVLVEIPKETNEYNIFALDTFGWDSTNYREAIDNIVLLHGDYVNVDIPYFEGMQSVKMPVLTTTGKNLFDGELKTFNNNTYISTPSYNNKPHTKLNPNTTYTISFEKQTTDSGIYLFTDTTLSRIISISNFSNYTFTTNNNENGISFYRRADKYANTNYQVQIEKGTQATPYEPFKSNILTVNDDVTLRGIGDVKDTLDCLTGELVQNIGEIMLDGSENWNLVKSLTNSTMFGAVGLPITSTNGTCITDKINSTYSASVDNNNIYIESNVIYITILNANLQSIDTIGFKQWLQKNPITVQYKLIEKSLKTVDLIPSGTHPSTTPYCWKDGHIQLSSSGLLPSLEYSVVTSRAGQISQNTAMIVKNDKRIFDLEILLAGGLVNTTYQALTLQNQVETGLSKVSLSSEKEPDYLLYHMIMKLIEEKAYKLDDLAEKVSVFYLYEKLSDEQFETIYAALYPFAEDEIIEEPVVEELPEVVEDEVIM